MFACRCMMLLLSPLKIQKWCVVTAHSSSTWKWFPHDKPQDPAQIMSLECLENATKRLQECCLLRLQREAVRSFPTRGLLLRRKLSDSRVTSPLWSICRPSTEVVPHLPDAPQSGISYQLAHIYLSESRWFHQDSESFQLWARTQFFLCHPAFQAVVHWTQTSKGISNIG